LISKGRKRKVCWERLILSGQQVVEGFFSDFDCKWEKTKQKKIASHHFFSVVESLSQDLGFRS
jgi:hypothetical protein